MRAALAEMWSGEISRRRQDTFQVPRHRRFGRPERLWSDGGGEPPESRKVLAEHGFEQLRLEA